MITLPAHLSLADWADQVVLDLDRYGAFGRIVNDDWREWGSQFLGVMGLGAYNLPNPYYFSDWREWANRFCGELA